MTVSDDYPQHWTIAQEHQFWDMTSLQRIKAGVPVYFWQIGASWLGMAVATSDAERLSSDADKPWDDTGKRVYRARFTFDMLTTEPLTQPTWGQVQRDSGIKSGLNRSVFEVDKPAQQLWLGSQFSDRSSQAEFSFSSDDLFFKAAADAEDDQRDRASRMVVIRQGQERFRSEVLEAYEGMCAISGSDIADALEAAHIRRYLGHWTNPVTNGILLRADLHRLFDRHLLTVLPDATILLAPELRSSAYAEFDGATLAMPSSKTSRPDAESLREHNRDCPWLSDRSIPVVGT
ncbi:HNH endonuclease [Phycicoccus flavus]|uniref:HNH nuclease domain-containing protein n=1 Tax=Phycicoccus flavus TaxID=2502783 RepID=A0A8T6R204_9MICO|nr:HNH endonuclease [Phycicoccus flavus]NHA66845.1 hypothetical protein [Phycicoccus flavus]